MGNHTTVYMQEYERVYAAEICVDGKKLINLQYFDFVELYPEPYVKKLIIFRYATHDFVSPLYYVSCGKRGVDAFPFRELTNVFDKWIWLLIFLSGICVITIPFWDHGTSNF